MFIIFAYPMEFTAGIADIGSLDELRADRGGDRIAVRVVIRHTGRSYIEVLFDLLGDGGGILAKLFGDVLE